MFKFHRRTPLLAFVLATLILAGCGNTGGGTTTTTQGTAAAPAPAAATTGASSGGASGGKTIRLGVWASPEELKFFEAWVAPFEKKTGYDVKIEYAAWAEYWTKLPSQFSAGNAPDVIEMSNYTQQFAPQNVLADLNTFVQSSNINKADYIDTPFEKFTQDGKLLSFPMGVTIQMLAYNKDIFDKAGVEYPTTNWTWDDLVQTATKLTVDANGKHPNENGFDPANVKQWGLEINTDEESGWAPLVFQNGGEYWNADYTAPNFTDPKVVEALQFQSDLINKFHVAPSRAQVTAMSGSPFTAGQAAMVRNGSYMIVPYKDNIKSFKWDVVSPPKGKEQGVFVDGIGWSLNNNSQNKDAGWELIQYFISAEGQKYMAEQHWQVPILKSQFDSFATPPPDHVGDLKDQFNYGHRWAAYKNGTQVDDIVGNVMNQLWDGKLTADQAAQQIQQQVTPLVK